MLLPPFLPVGKGEDAFSGRLCIEVMPQKCIGHVPVAALHDAAQGRKYGQGAEIRAVEFLMSLIVASPGHSIGDGRTALKAAGNTLTEVGRLPQSDF